MCEKKKEKKKEENTLQDSVENAESKRSHSHLLVIDGLHQL